MSEHPKKIWQSQPKENSEMTLKLIRSKARALQARTRRKLLGLLAGPAIAAFLYAFGIREFAPSGHLLHPLFAGALVWSLAGLYFLGRGMRSLTIPGDAGLSTGLEFCRGELERQQRLLRSVLVWSLAPILLSLATFVLGLAMAAKDRGVFPNGLPFLVLLVVWVIGYFVMREREVRELKREFEELNDLG